MKQNNLKICDASVNPGEFVNFALPLPDIHACAPMYMPIKIFHGNQKGPVVLVFSTLNGNELNGIEVVNRLSDSIIIERLKGTLILIPVLNVYGLLNFPTTLPTGGKLSSCFPGKENGTFGERLANVFTAELLKKVDYCIELQTGDINHNLLPQIYCSFEDATARNIAKAFGPPVISNYVKKTNNLHKTLEELHIPLLIYRAGEALRFDENAISLGMSGISKVLQHLGMIEKHELDNNSIKPLFSRSEKWLLAPKGGILNTDATLGQLIKAGELIGRISDPFGADTTLKVYAEQEGIVVGINSTPLIHEGLAIFKIATFIDYDKAENTIEKWDSSQPDSFLE